MFKRSMAALLTCAMTIGAIAPGVSVNAASKRTAAATVKQVVSVEQNSATVKYKVAKVKKAQYQVSTDAKFKTNVKSVKVKNSKKTTKLTLTGLSADTTYYFRVKGILTTKAEKSKYKVKWSKAVSFKTAAAAVTPAPAPDQTPSQEPATEFKLKQTEITLKQGGCFDTLDLIPDGIDHHDVTWTSPDPTIAGYEFGEIYAEGTITTITLTATYGTQTAQLIVHIVENPDYVVDDGEEDF